MNVLKDIRYPAKDRSAPQVAIIIPCYNDGAFILDAIQSCLRAEFTDWEMQIVDDGSTDVETIALLSQLRENGFPVIRQENKGLAAARNTGIKATSAPFIIPLDADNKLEDALAATGIPFLQAHPETDVFYTNCTCFGELTEIRNPGPPNLTKLLTGNYIDALALFRRSYWQSVGGYDENIPGNFYEDWEFWLHGMVLGKKFRYEPVVGFAYRVKPVSLVSKALIPESRMAAVRYIATKHKAAYAEGFIDAFVSLHGALAAWEGTGGQTRQALEAEFRQHRKVMEDAFAAETEKLHKHYETEREKVALHYFREREASEAHLYAQREEWEQAFRKNETIRIRELEKLLEDKNAEHQAELAGRMLIWEEEKESEKRSWEKKQAEMMHAHQAQEAHLRRVYEQKVREIEAHLAQEKISLSTFYLQQTAHLNEKEQQIQSALQTQRQYAEQLQRLITGYEQQVQDMQNTFTWRLRKNYYKFRNIFKGGRAKRKRIPGLGFIKRVFFFFTGKGRLIIRRFFKKIFRTLYIWLEEFPVRIIPANQAMVFGGDTIYAQWMARNFPREAEFKEYKRRSAEFTYKPLVSILMPVYNPPPQLFRETLNSVITQIYEHWELCIADDASTNPAIREILEEYRGKDYRIKVTYRKENGHISRSSNTALEMCTGEFTLLLDHDDLLTQDCIYQVVNVLNESAEADLLYSDEDKIDEQGTYSMPHFKPKWCPDNFTSRNYFGHVVVLRTAILKKIGGFRAGFEGSQDYDMLLRFLEESQRVVHIPHVLYHWRIHSASAASSEEAKPYAYEAARKALTESLARRGEPADVDFLAGYRGYSIRYHLQKKGKVSILIPTKDNTAVIRTCIDSIFGKSTWKDFEVIVISNNSTDKSLFQLLEQYKKMYAGKFTWFEHNVPFNFSALMNRGFQEATGAYFVLLNNDTEVITPDWMEGMMEQAQRKSIGAVGVKLLYPNETIQHAGVIVGLGGVAGHAFTAIQRDAAGYFNFIQSINNYSAVTAACLMVTREKYWEVQGFDEAFEVEYNDVDFCLRLQKNGYYNVYLPHVELFHHESLTRGHPHMSKESYERHIRELTLFKDRWMDIVEDDPCYSPHLTRGAHDFGIAL